MKLKVIHLQHIPYHCAQGFQRISIFNTENTGCKDLSMELVVLPKGAESTPHAHIGTETMIFTLKGQVTLYYGDKLQYRQNVKHLGCVYIPSDIIHYVVNEKEEEMIAIVSRTPCTHQIIEYADLSI